MHGTVTAPSVEEMQQSIIAGIAQILSFKDDRGRPMNTNARRSSSPSRCRYMDSGAPQSAMLTSALLNNQTRSWPAGIDVRIEMMPELTWTDSFAVWRTDSPSRV